MAANPGFYQSILTEGCWQLRAVGYVRVPDPAEELRVENERLRAQPAAQTQASTVPVAEPYNPA